MRNRTDLTKSTGPMKRGAIRELAWGMTAATLPLLLLLAGCATRDPSSVDAAREAVASSKDTGLVDSDSLDFREAERHLSEAEKMLENKDDQALIDHEAQMAALYAEIAVARTEAIAARAETDAYMNRARTDTATTRVAVEIAIRNARNIDAQQTGRGLVLTLGGVLFNSDSADLTPEAQLSVARVAGFLIALADRDALIEGYADSTGAADYNLELSKRRAQSILSSLVDSGVAPERLASEGYGSLFPAASNETREGRERNRRVEIVILKPGLRASEALPRS